MACTQCIWHAASTIDPTTALAGGLAHQTGSLMLCDERRLPTFTRG